MVPLRIFSEGEALKCCSQNWYKGLSVVHSFVHPFIQQILTERLVCSRHWL